MRASLLIVALACMVAMVSAQTYYTTTLKGTFYATADCTGTSSAVSLTYSTASALTYPCVGVTIGSQAWAITGECFTYAGSTTSTWTATAYLAGVCPTSGTGTPTGAGSNWGVAGGSDFTTKQPFSYIAAGVVACFQPTGCSSSASTLIVPSFLLVALAFAASKLQL